MWALVDTFGALASAKVALAQYHERLCHDEEMINELDRYQHELDDRRYRDTGRTHKLERQVVVGPRRQRRDLQDLRDSNPKRNTLNKG